MTIWKVLGGLQPQPPPPPASYAYMVVPIMIIFGPCPPPPPRSSYRGTQGSCSETSMPMKVTRSFRVHRRDGRPLAAVGVVHLDRAQYGSAVEASDAVDDVVSSHDPGAFPRRGHRGDANPAVNLRVVPLDRAVTLCAIKATGDVYLIYREWRRIWTINKTEKYNISKVKLICIERELGEKLHAK